MDIRNCEFCNAYVADFEVHTCKSFGNQHRQSSATLPRSSSDDIDQDSDLRAEQIHYEERIQSMNQTLSLWQLSIFPNIRQKTDYEETSAAEVSSQFGIANPYNPEISDCLSHDMAHGEENQTESVYSLQLSEDNSVLINQNPQFCEAWNPNPDVNAPLPVAEPCFLPGFQQTFGQRNPWKNQIAEESSEMGCSGASRSDENSHYVSGFNESGNASINQLSQHYETSYGIPILAVQNPQYNPMDPIPPTDAVSPTQSNIRSKEFQPKDHLEPQDRSRSLARRYSCSFCDKTFPTSWNLSNHVRTHTGETPYKCTVCNKCCTQRSHLTAHIRMHNRKTLHKCTECSECFVFRSRLEEHFSSVHPGKNLYKCKQCGKGFDDNYTLRRHFRSVHTDHRPHKCTECGKCFADVSNLKRHMLLHNKV